MTTRRPRGRRRLSRIPGESKIETRTSHRFLDAALRGSEHRIRMASQAGTLQNIARGGPKERA